MRDLDHDRQDAVRLCLLVILLPIAVGVAAFVGVMACGASAEIGAVSRTERNILSALKRWNPTAPEEVLAAEARYRLQFIVLGAAEAGATQQSIAERHGYSVSQIERIIRAAKRDQSDGRVPTLAAWRAHDDAARAEPKAPAPEEALTPNTHSIGFDVKSEPVPTIAELQARIKALMEAREDAEDDADDEAPEPVYAVVPYTHFKVQGRHEYIVVDNMSGLKAGAQVSFISNGLFGPQACRRIVKSVQQVHQSQCLSLQVVEPGRT